MRIRSIQAIPLSFRLPEGKTVRLGVGVTTKRDAIIVKVVSDEGVVGYGEAHPGRSPGAIVSLIQNTLAPILSGLSVHDTNSVWTRINRMQLSSHGLGAGAALALSGIDMALWDLRAKALSLPLYSLLGGSHKRIAAYAGGISMGFQAADALAEEAESYVEMGYRAIKLRLGDNVKDDIARVRRVRSQVGDGITILVDANTSYNMTDVRSVLPVLEECEVAWLEEPFGCNDFGAYRQAAQLTNRVALAAGENHYTRFEFARLIEERAIGILQPDLSKTGGISEGLKIAAMASAWGLPVHPHSSATGINHLASIHFLASIDNGGYFEACVSAFNPLRDMFGKPFSIDKDGFVQPSSSSGIGLEVDESIFTKYPFIDGPGYLVTFDK
ncbi:MAG: mandelate racemase/muconate lactonizing enzyme family protein [Betaproteobacteria bacterium]|nr:mandelate racemase/muconate lactonizing enzyme family protein [Betaproteobacteria bacterium]